MDGVIDLQAVEDRVEITNTTIGSVLTLRRVALSDGGRYFCVTFNPVQTSIQADSSVVLNVEGKHTSNTHTYDCTGRSNKAIMLLSN